MADAREAITAQMPELLIVDYTLPDGTASDVLAHLDNDERKRPRVVVCSGHGYDLPVSLLKAGAHVLAKPFRLDQLDATVKALLE